MSGVPYSSNVSPRWGFTNVFVIVAVRFAILFLILNHFALICFVPLFQIPSSQVPATRRSKCGMQVPQPPELIHLIAPLILPPPPQCRELERALQGRECRSLRHHVRAVRSRRQDDRLRWRIRDAQSVGCGCVGTDTPEPSRPKLSLPYVLQLPWSSRRRSRARTAAW